MLQQTRVEVVEGRWGPFLERFPNVKSLAEATLSEVLAHWAGLGYYRRAHQLHAAACVLVEEYGGELPSFYESLRRLPGMGPYTAGAVASIAFGEAVPAVDGNVERVLCRLLALEGDPKRRETAAILRSTVQGFLETTSPATLNQALMELGALVCLPRKPLCGECPWSEECRAYELSQAEDYPRRPPRPGTLEVAAYAAVQSKGGRYLFRRRVEGGHNQGLWEIPSIPWHPGLPDAGRARPLLEELGRSFSVRWEVRGELTRVKHTITRHRITLAAYAVEGEEPLETEDLRWATATEAAAFGLTAAASKLCRRLVSPEGC